MRPAVALNERGGAGDQHQFADFLRSQCGNGECQLRAERPAAERAAGGQASRDIGGGGVEIFNQRGIAIAGQVEKTAVKRVDRSIERAAAQTPAGNENKRSGHASSLSALISWSISAAVWAADSEMRRRAVSFGTVGGRIAGVHRPRSQSAFDRASAASFWPTMSG